MQRKKMRPLGAIMQLPTSEEPRLPWFTTLDSSVAEYTSPELTVAMAMR